MRHHGLLPSQQGQSPAPKGKHYAKVASDTSNTHCCADGFEVACDNSAQTYVAFVHDCYGCKVMSWVATTTGIYAELVGSLMLQAAKYRFGVNSAAPID
jgi:putative transposase